MRFLIIMKNKYFMHLIIFEPLTSRGEFLVKELPTPCNYSRGWMEKERSGAVAPDAAVWRAKRGALRGVSRAGAMRVEGGCWQHRADLCLPRLQLFN